MGAHHSKVVNLLELTWSNQINHYDSTNLSELTLSNQINHYDSTTLSELTLSNQISHYDFTTLSELISSNQTDTSNFGPFFARIPKEIRSLIMSKFSRFDFLKLAMTSSLFLKFFTFYVGHLSNEQEPDPVLIHLCNESCTQASFPKIIPQFLALNSNQLVESRQKIHPPMDVVVINRFEDIPSAVLPESRDVLINLPNESCTQVSFPKISPQFLALNSNQLVESTQKIHPPMDVVVIDRFEDIPSVVQLVESRQKIHPPMDVVIIDCFEDIPSVVLPESRDVLINLPNYESLRIGIRDSIIQISKALQCHKHLKAENLVLNNFVWSSESIEYLLTTFNELKKLNVTSFNPNCELNYIFLSDNTTLDELEMTLPSSKDFLLCPPAKMTKLTINTLQPNPGTGKGNLQTIDACQSTLLTALILKKHHLDLNILILSFSTLRLEILIFNGNGKCMLRVESDDLWYPSLIIIHIGKYDKFSFVNELPGGEKSLKHDMVPNCKQFGVFDKFGKLQIIWEKQS
jgi:hypothetical protein